MEEFLLKIKDWGMSVINFCCGGVDNEKNATERSVSDSTRNSVIVENDASFRSNKIRLNEEVPLFRGENYFAKIPQIPNLTIAKSDNAEVSVQIKNDDTITDKSEKQATLSQKEVDVVRDPIIERSLVVNEEARRESGRVSLELEENPFEEARKNLYEKLIQEKKPLFPSPNDTERVKYYQEKVRKDSDERDGRFNEILAQEREARANGKLSFHTRIINKKEFERS